MKIKVVCVRRVKVENRNKPVCGELQIEDSAKVILRAGVWSDGAVETGVDPRVVTSSSLGGSEHLPIPQPT